MFCQKLAYENLVKHFCEDGLTSRCNDCILTLIGLNLCSILHKDVGIVQMKWAGHMIVWMCFNACVCVSDCLCLILVFSCPADSSIGDLVTHSLIHSLSDF